MLSYFFLLKTLTTATPTLVFKLLETDPSPLILSVSLSLQVFLFVADHITCHSSLMFLLFSHHNNYFVQQQQQTAWTGKRMVASAKGPVVFCGLTLDGLYL